MECFSKVGEPLEAKFQKETSHFELARVVDARLQVYLFLFLIMLHFVLILFL